jgi:prolyl-tRNA editing enzyme YbaK/EbsC (Cys-tRNA(Pro) deacylase)
MPEPVHPAHQRVRDAARQRGVDIEIVTFDESTHTAQEAADAIGVQLGQIVKSLVFMAPLDPARVDGELEPVIALVRGTDRVDIAKLASVSARPRIRRASADEAYAATGYAIGGIPPFGHRQRIAVVMDPALDGYEQVWAAAGTANAVFAIAPATLAMLSGALVAPCAEQADPAASTASTSSTPSRS